MKKNFSLSVLSFIILFTKCSGENTVDSKSTNHDTVSVVSDHFSFLIYDGLSQNISEPILKKLEDNYARVLDDLRLSSINKVTIKIWNDETHFLNNMQNDLGIKYPGALGYVYNGSEVRILFRGNAAQNVLHEFCHVASLVVNSRLGNNPRWFWEAVAVYEAGEFRDPKTINYLVNGNFPTIAELNLNFNNGNNKIYEVGYLLAEFIINTWGKSNYILLIKTNGNVQGVLNITIAEFESRWKESVSVKYLSN